MQRRKRAHLVDCPEGDAVLAVAVDEGAADLGRAVVLRGAARRIYQDWDSLASPADVAGVLEREGAGPDRAAHDADGFIADLRRHGLIEGASDTTQGDSKGRASEDAGDTETKDDSVAEATVTAPDALVHASELEKLARTVLGGGDRLRFRALGRSMRPFLPHGSLLEVEPTPFEEIRTGDVILYATPETRLVAHRVIDQNGAILMARGDSSSRIDRVEAPSYLGRVSLVQRPLSTRWVPVSTGSRRVLGLLSGQTYAAATGALRTVVIGPLRRTYGKPSRVRAAMRFVLRGVGGSLYLAERLMVRLRRPVDVVRAALYTTDEKEEERVRLYNDRSVQQFTSLDENVVSGLTLLEEVIFSRHDIPVGDALIVGCGPGRECLAMARMGYRVTGLDREVGMLARARTLAEEYDFDVDLITSEAHVFDLGERRFDVVVIFSGLYNMVLPRSRRLEMLRSSFQHLRPGGLVLVTFLSAYLLPGVPPRPKTRSLCEALNPEHEDGDKFMLNETVHIFPRAEDIADEAREVGLETIALERDQRAYDRAEGQVKGYAVLKRPEASA